MRSPSALLWDKVHTSGFQNQNLETISHSKSQRHKADARTSINKLLSNEGPFSNMGILPRILGCVQ
jgi:hypothetical protein